MKTRIIAILLLLSFMNLSAQDIPIQPRWTNGFWQARWIGHPTASGSQFGVFHFRKTIELEAAPGKFIVHVSGDNRYRLFVNGKSVGTGPARSDLANWNFETYDIGPLLKAGMNIVAATVWNFAEYRPYSQLSFETGFVLQGDTEKEKLLNTNKTWKVYHNTGYSPLPANKSAMQAYFVVAEGEKVDAAQFPWGFEETEFDDTKWATARELWYNAKSRTFGTDGNWQLVPRSIPMLEEKLQSFFSLREETAKRNYWNPEILERINYFKVPAKTTKRYLLDQGELTNAYPAIAVNGGKNAKIRMSYAEALFDSARNKGNRNEVQGKQLIGFSDEYITDGGASRTYSPLHFRTFRYILLEITTADEELVVEDLYSLFTAYPFKEKGFFSSDQPRLKQIWNTGWRTARLCAADSYFDCPYYEQLQYVGDTRIQALISLYVSGDDRLMRKAITDLSHSFIPDGLTQSRYPSRDLQVIPTFSLWWVCMIHDYWMHRTDDAFVKATLNGVSDVLQWYKDKMASDNILGPLSWWQFTDWSWPWVDSIQVGGVPPGASHGGSSIISLQYAYTLQRAAALFAAYGQPQKAADYLQEYKTITKAVYQQCWDPARQLVADTRQKQSFSQHANIMAILTDAIPVAEQPALIQRILTDRNMTQATYYFKFYLFEALAKTREGNRFIGLLKPWEEMLDQGLTTFAEEPDPTRSDCHAWSASPNYELLSLVCGIRPAASGFSKVLIRPYPGSLRECTGSVPVPGGAIWVKYEFKGNKIRAAVILPKGMSGTLEWNNKTIALKEGEQVVEL